jgi:Flp pilus assembly protein TadD
MKPPIAARQHLPWIVGGALAVLVLAVFGQVRGFAFVNVDDQRYVYENPFVRNGLTWDGVREAFSVFRSGNWHPVTWLSHMADVQLFGLDAGWHHLVGVALHATSAILLFTLLRGATGSVWRSAFVAALFAVHPLHVESVAWVAERKDVLSTALFLAALNAYVAYARRPRPGPYAAVVALFGLGLLAKPMLVTFPFVLLLLDAWPLRRLAGGPSAGFAQRGPGPLVLEKLPLLARSAAASVLAVLAQSAAEADVSAARVAMGARIANAIVSYDGYLGKTVWPARLAEYYPHPYVFGGGLPGWQIAGAAAILLAITGVALRERSRRPYLLVGWLWYLGTLVPVIGLVQVGLQASADRYTYIPLIGVFVAVVWGIGDAIPPAWHRIAAAGACAALAALGWVAHAQASVWRDSESLHRHALAVSEQNWKAWVSLGDALSEAGRPAEALAAYQEGLRIVPEFAGAWNGVGVALGRLGQPEQAIEPLSRAVRIEPAFAEAWYNLGTAYGNLGRHDEAARCFRRALQQDPQDARAWLNLGIASANLGDRAAAAESVERLRRLDPGRAAQLRSLLAAMASP